MEVKQVEDYKQIRNNRHKWEYTDLHNNCHKIFVVVYKQVEAVAEQEMHSLSLSCIPSLPQFVYY